MNKLKYPINIRPLSKTDGGGYIAEFPDLPGCIATGSTVEEVLDQADDAMKSWLKTAKEFGDEIPEPTIASNFSGQWRIRLPKSLHAALALEAKMEGVSLNTLTATLLAKCMGQKIADKKHQR